jgi:DNA-binding CsgD family transcriptional regulator
VTTHGRADRPQHCDLCKGIGEHADTLCIELMLLRRTRSDAYGESASDLRVVSTMMPHVQQGCQLHRRLMALELEIGAAMTAMERLAFGVILLAEDRSAVFVNREARRILNLVTKLRLKPPSKTEPRAARRIFVTRRPFGPHLRQLLKPNRPQLVSPATTPGFRRCLVALLIPEGEIGLPKSGHLLRNLYGLTQREADVASDLVQGHRVSDIARLRELSVNTVRTHLKRLLEKTRTTRQADLFRVLVASFPPVEHE